MCRNSRPELKLSDVINGLMVSAVRQGVVFLVFGEVLKWQHRRK